ncbi:MAG: hypothetical protein NZ893_01740, partial [Candidatus Aenigmarchaeota archaeon]|nr:hypothetical protein [Candidatus Aenigmarchaeota archaeon]
MMQIAAPTPLYSDEKTKRTSSYVYVEIGFEINFYDEQGISDVVFEFNQTNYTYLKGTVFNESNIY